MPSLGFSDVRAALDIVKYWPDADSMELKN